jgi:hypothetical protein
MFEINKMNNFLKDNIDDYLLKMKKEIEKELKSKGYLDIFKNFKINLTKEGMTFNFDFKEDIEINENQDVIEVLTRGGVFKKKDGTYIKISPSIVLSKYLSKR